MNYGPSPMSPRSLTRLVAFAKDQRTGNHKTGIVTDVPSTTELTVNGRRWNVLDFSPDGDRDCTLINLTNNKELTIVSNTEDTIVTSVAHGMSIGDSFIIQHYIEPDIVPLPHFMESIALKSKDNRNDEMPINSMSKYMSREIAMSDGNNSGTMQGDDVFISPIGMLTGVWDWHTGDALTYDTEEGDRALGFWKYSTETPADDALVNLAELNYRSALNTYSPQAIIDGTGTVDDSFIIMGADIFNAIRTNNSIDGAGTASVVWYYTSEGIWKDLSEFIVKDETIDTVAFDQSGILLFTPPLDWEPMIYENPDDITDYTQYGYGIRAVFQTGVNYNLAIPTLNCVKLSYMTPTFTMRSYLERGANRENRVLCGAHPLKATIKFESRKPIEFEYDWQGNTLLIPHTISTGDLPTKSRAYKQRHYLTGKDISVTLSNSTLVETVAIEKGELSIDSKGEGMSYVGFNTAIQTFYKGTLTNKLKITTSKRNSELWKLWTLDGNVPANQVTAEIKLSKSYKLNSTITELYASSYNKFKVGVLAAPYLHKGQLISLREDGKIYYHFVTSVNLSNYEITLTEGAGYDWATDSTKVFTDAADLYLEDYFYVKFNSCIIDAPDLSMKSKDTTFTEEWELTPLGYHSGSTHNFPIELRCRPAAVV